MMLSYLNNATACTRCTRYGFLLIMVSLLIIISTITRLVLAIYSWTQADFFLLNIMGMLLLGLFYDLINAAYFIIPWVVYLWLMPGRWYRKTWHLYILAVIFSINIFLLLFNGVAEWFFWEEFNTRFNFIAVDYLVYTTEVLGNIQQSYPIGWIIAALVAATGIMMWRLYPKLRDTLQADIPFKRRTVITLILLFIPVLLFITVNNRWHQFSRNTMVNELSGNGMYELFAAYRNNELDFKQFYVTLTDEESFRIVRHGLQTPDARFVSTEPCNLTRSIEHAEPERRLNVVLISVESLSADFMDAFGNSQHITPFLDSLAGHSLFFTNVYATGTRTVRGLEALSLCIPPTPGQSIVRRPNNEHLFTLGNVFEQKGYRTKFVYGGYSYFDNMGYFFANNDYAVADRSLLKEEEIDYENIWGVADENLFTLATREIEAGIASGKPVFAHVMTTSNHRPYTYPDGRIDIPSHTNRDGAVKYTDYAIGNFIRSCRNKPWFDQTVFVIVADHCASSAGKTELPVNKYHIPLLIYSPANISAQRVDRLMSQIDLGPTLLGLLNFDYTSKFFGYDIFRLEPGRERAFVSTYQSLGYIKDNKLVILLPQRKVAEVVPNFQDGSATPVSVDGPLLQEAIAWYQASSYAFKEGLYHEDQTRK